MSVRTRFGAGLQDCHRFIGVCCFGYAVSLLAQLISRNKPKQHLIFNNEDGLIWNLRVSGDGGFGHGPSPGNAMPF